MSTNYYAHIDSCPCCKEAKEVLHIGKSSVGWAFALHVNLSTDTPELRPPNNFINWLRLLSQSNVVIKDEYGDEVHLKKLLNIMLERPKNVRRTEHAIKRVPGFPIDLVEGHFS